MVIPHRHNHPTMAGSACHIGVPHHVTRAIDARPLAIPHAKYPIDPAFAAQDRANLAAWAKSGVRRLGVYDYLYGAEVASPRVNLTALIQSIHTAYTAGARGWYAEAYPLWAFDAPKLWIAAKLLEDRMANTETLRRTWFARAYGPAADEMIAAYAQIEAAWKRDAIVGGKDQFLRHFHDQRGALVLSSGEIAAISQHLLAAQQILRDPTSDAGARRRNLVALGSAGSSTTAAKKKAAWDDMQKRKEDIKKNAEKNAEIDKAKEEKRLAEEEAKRVLQQQHQAALAKQQHELQKKLADGVMTVTHAKQSVGFLEADPGKAADC